MEENVLATSGSRQAFNLRFQALLTTNGSYTIPLRLSLSMPVWPNTPFDKLRVSGVKCYPMTPLRKLEPQAFPNPLSLSLSKPGWPKIPFDRLRVSGNGMPSLDHTS